MEWITHESLAKSPTCLPIDDLIYLPEELDQFEAEDIIFAVKNNPEAQKALPIYVKDVRDHHPLTIIEILKFQSRMHLEKHGSLPEWAQDLPRPFHRLINIERALVEDQYDHYAIIPGHRFARVPYIVLNDGLVADTCKAFGLFRLSYIGQLGYLHDAIVDEFGQRSTLGWTYQHTRYHHVLNVMALMTLMMCNNGITGSDYNTGRVAALTHDVLTPAGGDTTKLLDYDAFDEDKHYPEVFERYDLNDLITKYQIDRELLIQTIQGKGRIGILLNYADKLAYIATDLSHYLKQPRTAKLEPDPIVVLGERHPHLCTIWDDVHVQGDEVYFTNIQRLSEFLYTRAMMFQQFYWHPNTRFLEFTVGTVLLKYLYQTGKITREMLLKMGDDELNFFMGEQLELPRYAWTSSVFGEPQVELFENEEAALQRESELIRQGIFFVAIENLPRRFKAGTHMLVQYQDEIVPLSVADPGLARFLDSKTGITHPYRLYYIKDLRVSERFKQAFKAYQENRLKNKSA